MYHHPSHDEKETSVTSFIDLPLFKFPNTLSRNDDDGIRTCTAESEELVASQGAACRATCSSANSPPTFRSLRRPCPRIVCPDDVDRTACTAPGVTYAAAGFVRGIQDSSHVIRGPTRKTLVFTTLQNVSSSLTHSYSGIQSPIQTIFSLAAWGRHSPRSWCVARPRRALSPSRGSV